MVTHLESRDSKLSRSKTEYLRSTFSGSIEDSGEVNIDRVTVLMLKKYKYFGSII